MKLDNTTWTRRLAILTAMLLVGGAALTFAPSATAHGGNHGTIKVHDNETAEPERRNEPHVTCDFWIEGFNMEGNSGNLTFYAWPPTGNKTVEMVANYTADSGDGKEGYHFVTGPLQLPPGHYKLEAYADAGHPGGHGHFAKAKVFWVDECEDGEIPVFPTVAAGIAATALGAVAYLAVRRR